MLMSLMRKLFDAKYVDYRVHSGSIANLYAYMATTKPLDNMETIAGFFCRVLVQKDNPVKLKPAVIEFRKQFQQLHFIRT